MRNITYLRCGLLWGVIILCFSYATVMGKTNKSISPDLAVNFKCKIFTPSELATAIEKFLREKEFEIINVVKYRKRIGLAPMSFTLLIDGIDKSRRMINFLSLAPDVYSVALFSPPPTRPATALEEAIVRFVSDTMKCKVSNVSRNRNNVEKIDYYNEIFNSLENRIKGQGM